MSCTRQYFTIKLRLRYSFCAIVIIHSPCSNHHPVEGFRFSMKITLSCGLLGQMIYVARAKIHLAETVLLFKIAHKCDQANCRIAHIQDLFCVQLYRSGRIPESRACLGFLY